MRLLAASIVVLTSPAAMGCSAVVDDAPSGDARGPEGATLRASVSVQRTASVNGGAVRTQVAARFLRASGALVQAERMVDESGLDPAAPLGCSFRDDEPVRDADGVVELLDVGEIVLHVHGASAGARGGLIALAPRAFPDVGGLVSGVVYTSRDGRRDLPESATYLFEIGGSRELDGVSLEADAPAAPADVRVSGTALSSTGLVVRSGEAVELTWTGSSEPDDRIYVTVTDNESGGLTCVFEDDGAARIPENLVDFGGGAVLDMMIHRHRRAFLIVPGADYDAVVDFDFAVAAQLDVE